MRPEEHKAHEFLCKRGFDTLVYEPNGPSTAPDFAANNRIAIEVTRLNETRVFGEKRRGIEDLLFPLRSIFIKNLGTFNELYTGNSYWVELRFGDHLGLPFREIELRMKNVLRDFLKYQCITPSHVSVCETIELFISESQPMQGVVFRDGGYTPNLNVTSQVLEIYTSSVLFNLEKKNQKIQGCINQYSERWLLFVDFMGWHLGKGETAVLRNRLTNIGSFTKLLIINNNLDLLFEI